MPESSTHATPLLFVHGAYAAAWCWQEHYLPYFAAQGFAAHALSLSGHGGSRGRQYLDTYSISHYVDDLREVAASLPVRPILIGHSMGGMVVQKFLEHENVPAVVLMASVPPRGLMNAALDMLLHRPGMLFDLNRTLGGGQPHLEALREALFHQPISDAMLKACYMRMQPESLRAIWDMSVFDLPSTSRMHRPPMLVLGAEHDRLIQASQVEKTAEIYDVVAEIFPAMGHGMMLEANWQDPAQRIRDWLIEQGF
ncbi:MAG TPA: alpha/beta fold hydrolase [Rhodocyclaceae bacterium]|nr:alpha/beta fold hydrolase [Rhodocyclaceae bacterium]